MRTPEIGVGDAKVARISQAGYKRGKRSRERCGVCSRVPRAFGRVPSGPHEKKPPGAGERSTRINSSQAYMELATVCIFTSPNGNTSDHTSRGTKLALD